MLRMSKRPLAAIAAALIATTAPAALVTFDYVAQGGAGVTITGSFGWDDATPDSNAWGHIGQYSSGFINAFVSGGDQDGASVSLSNLTWSVYDGAPGQVVDSLNVLNSPTWIQLDDVQGTSITSDALPATLDLGGFEGRQLAVAAAGVQRFYTLTSLTPHDVPAAVPEPDTAPLLLAAGFAAWVAGGRRRTTLESRSQGR